MQAQLFTRGGEATSTQQVCARPSCASSRRNRGCERHAAAVEAPSAQQPFRQQHGRIYNFSAGPACLPQAVLEQAQAELLNWRGSGMSVMEMSHRGKEFVSILEQSVADLQDLLKIPDNYKIFYVQGGGTGQFAGVPLNLTKAGDTVDHFVTGSWSKKAAQEAGKYGLKVNIAGKGDGKSIPEASTWNLSPDAAYLHYCDNETISGVEFKEAPEAPSMLVADMSSSFCSKPVDVAKYGVIYAGAQKNIGPAGATIMIVREDLLGKQRPETPSVMEYNTMSDSLFNTPPCYPIYMCGLVFAHMRAQGGIPAYYKTNQRKAQQLYDAIDGSSGFYNSPVAVKDRSLMNVAFTIPEHADLEKSFVSQAAKEGMVQLKGHRSVGGMRASIYNAMPEEGVSKLVAFMKDFAASNA